MMTSLPMKTTRKEDCVHTDTLTNTEETKSDLTKIQNGHPKKDKHSFFDASSRSSKTSTSCEGEKPTSEKQNELWLSISLDEKSEELNMNDISDCSPPPSTTTFFENLCRFNKKDTRNFVKNSKPDNGSIKSEKESSQRGCLCTCGICSKDTEPESGDVFHWYYFVLGLAGLGLCYLDIVTDLALAVELLKRGEYMYGGVTLGLVLPSYIFSYVYFAVCLLKDQDSRRTFGVLGVACITLLGFAFFPAFAVAYHLYNGCQSRSHGLNREEREDRVRQMKKGRAGSIIFRVLEAYLQSAPQLVWQLYVLLRTRPAVYDSAGGGALRVLVLISSLSNLVVTQAVTDTFFRNAFEDRPPPATLSSQLFDFLWRVVQVSGRVLCIAFFASVFDWWWVLAVLLPHGLLVFAFIFRKMDNRGKPLERLARLVVCSYIGVFSPFSFELSLRPSRYRWYLALNVVFVVENVVMVLMWYFYTPDEGAWFHTWGLVGVVVSFVVHVTLQGVYYLCCHPSSHAIPLCRPCDLDTCRKECWEPEGGTWANRSFVAM